MDGVIVIDKPKGWTSHDVVAKVRTILAIKKIGHIGTLDPFSTGVLPLCIGRATRLSSLLTNSEKVYSGEMRFGFSTDTYDVEGKQIGEYRKPSLTVELIANTFAQFTGDIIQRPPLYSAKKIGGIPLYKYARKGIDIERPPKKVSIKSLRLLGLNRDIASFEVTCSMGTYVRALAHDIGKTLECGAHLFSLHRTRSGNLDITQAIKLKYNDKVIQDKDYYCNHLIPMDQLLPEIPALIASRSLVHMVAHGRGFVRSQLESNPESATNLYRVLDDSGQLLAIVEKSGTTFRPKIVLK